MSTLQQAVASKYGRDVLQPILDTYYKVAVPQSDEGMPGMRQFFLARGETSPQGEGFEKHPDSTDEHMIEMLCKLLLYAPDDWYETVVGRPKPEEFKNEWKQIGVAFDASSRLRRAGIEYYHKKKTMQHWLASSPPFDTPCVFFFDPSEKNLKKFPLAQLPSKPIGTVRVVAVSDTHLLHRYISLPAGDLLVHAGDVSYEESRSNDGALFDQFAERNGNFSTAQFLELFRSEHTGLADALRWLGEAPGFKHKVLTGGNHDYILDQLGEHADEVCRQYGVQYLKTKNAPVELRFAGGEVLSVWGSGVSTVAGLDASRAVKSGNASFQVDVTNGDSFLRECDHVTEADIMVTHTPPVGMLLGKEGKTFDAINKLVERVKPQLYVCGHAHNEQDLLKGRHAAIGETIGINAACVSTWNYLHGYPIVVDVQPRKAAGGKASCDSDPHARVESLLDKITNMQVKQELRRRESEEEWRRILGGLQAMRDRFAVTRGSQV